MSDEYEPNDGDSSLVISLSVGVVNALFYTYIFSFSLTSADGSADTPAAIFARCLISFVLFAPCVL